MKSSAMEFPFQGLVPVVIGVTGHRDIPASDIELLTIATRSALTGIEQSSPHSPHIMLTSLAEGGDRIAAKVAIGMGWMVGVVLPAPVELYALDFKTAESQAEFRDLLGKAAWVEALPAGSMTPAAYRAAGIRIARQSLYLLALWDGDETVVEGGTADIVDLFRHGIPEERMAGAADNSLLEARPVLHISTRRQGNPGAVAEPEVGRLDWIAPEPEGTGSDGELGRWAAVLRHIDQFNCDATECLARNGGEVTKSRGHLLDAESDAGLPMQARLAAALHAVADTISMEAQARRRLHIKILFVLAMGAVISEQAYSGWAYKPVFLVLAVASGIGAWLVYALGAHIRLENRYLDCRALAEACRVQYFWKRAGLKACAADHFLRDQRDELEWIRRAVRATDLLSGDIVSSRAQMEHVAKAWLAGQRDYFIGPPEEKAGGKAGLNRIKDKLWSKIASVLFKAGIAAMIILAIFHVFTVAEFGEADNLATLTITFAYGMLFACAGLIKVHQEMEAFAEQANRYRRMGMALTVARRRLAVALEKGEMADAENVLLGAGRDALEESGGWLLLHRERPVKVPLG